MIKVSYIRHENNEWVIYSKKGKVLGKYETKQQAKKRLSQIEYFKRKATLFKALNSVAGKTFLWVAFSAIIGALGVSVKEPSTPPQKGITITEHISMVDFCKEYYNISDEKLHDVITALSEYNGVDPEEDLFNKNITIIPIEEIISVPVSYDIYDFEGFSTHAYDDATGKRINKGEPLKGNATIGFGHMLTKKELETGKLSVDGKLFSWEKGISKDNLYKLYQQDVAKLTNPFDNVGSIFSYKQNLIIEDLCFLWGPQRVISYFNKERHYSDEEFREQLKSFPVGKEKGHILRRIVHFLILDDLLLPKPEGKTFSEKLNSVKLERKFSFPTKEALEIFIIANTGKSDFSLAETNKLLDIIANKSISYNELKNLL